MQHRQGLLAQAHEPLQARHRGIVQPLGLHTLADAQQNRVQGQERTLSLIGERA